MSEQSSAMKLEDRVRNEPKVETGGLKEEESYQLCQNGSDRPEVKLDNGALKEEPSQVQVGGLKEDEIFKLCRNSKWTDVLAQVIRCPDLGVSPMTMDNHIATTILHQAITSKGNIDDRAAVISTILRQTPHAAQIKNGYGSLPLHVIAQRNTKINAQTKERLIKELANAYLGAMVESGGVGKRTPLHIIFTDYVSPKLTKIMIDKGSKACFMRDKKGFLPAHVACSRHCSPEKLRMLLEVNPGALFEKTDKGETLLDLATSTATKSHPNYALIEELNLQISSRSQVNAVSSEDDSEDTFRRSRTDSAEWQNLEPTPYNPRREATFMVPPPPPPPPPPPRHFRHPGAVVTPSPMVPAYHHHPTPIGHHGQHHLHHQHFHHPTMNQHVPDRLVYPGHHVDPYPPSYGYYPTNEYPVSRKRKSEEEHIRQEERKDDVDPAASLLLHFSRNSVQETPKKWFEV